VTMTRMGPYSACDARTFTGQQQQEIVALDPEKRRGMADSNGWGEWDILINPIYGHGAPTSGLDGPVVTVRPSQ